MLRSLCCHLTAHSKAAGIAIRPALQGGLRGCVGPSAILPSQNFVCQYGTGVRQIGLLSLKNVSGYVFDTDNLILVFSDVLFS